jgi:hypothetical protein
MAKKNQTPEILQNQTTNEPTFKVETPQGDAETPQGDAETPQGDAETPQGDAETPQVQSEARSMGERDITVNEPALDDEAVTEFITNRAWFDALTLLVASYNDVQTSNEAMRVQQAQNDLVLTTGRNLMVNFLNSAVDRNVVTAIDGDYFVELDGYHYKIKIAFNQYVIIPFNPNHIPS